MSLFHKLDKDHNVVPCTAEEFAAMSDEERRVGRDQIGDYLVSTAFLGIDHGHGHKPFFFETMIFCPVDEVYCERRSTWAEAEEEHARGVRIAKEAMEELKK